MLVSVDAIVTAPISKTSWKEAGIQVTGHTTLLQQLTSSKHVTMGFYTPKLSTVLATVHVPLSHVPDVPPYAVQWRSP